MTTKHFTVEGCDVFIEFKSQIIDGQSFLAASMSFGDKGLDRFAHSFLFYKLYVNGTFESYIERTWPLKKAKEIISLYREWWARHP